MKIHAINYDYEALPAQPVLLMLESQAFMWFIVLVSVAFVFWLLAKAWQIHSIPKKKSTGQAQARLVFWLCLLGLMWKPLWLAAVILILIDWQAFAMWIRLNIISPLPKSNANKVKTLMVSPQKQPSNNTPQMEESL